MSWDDSNTVVELEGVNGEWFTLAGPQAGDRGVYLSSGVKGLYDPPVKMVWEEFGTYPGARFLNHRIMRRDMTFAVDILNDRFYEGEGWISRDSEWRKAWSYTEDCKLHVTHPMSSHRVLKLRLQEAPEIMGDVDPEVNPINTVAMQTASGDPFWYGDDVVYTMTTGEDTRFDARRLLEIPYDMLPKENLYITVDPSDGKGGLNPTDQDIYLKWGLPASTENVTTLLDLLDPGYDGDHAEHIAEQIMAITGLNYVPGLQELASMGQDILIAIFDMVDIPLGNAPNTIWVIPDYSFTDSENSDRRVRMPGLLYGQDAIVDTDPRAEQVSAADGSQVWARMNGVRLRNPVPAYTKSRTFHLTVTGAVPGQMVSLRIPRPWSRPWGLE